MSYDNLLSKGKIGPLELKNRIIMPAMGEGLSDPSGNYVEDLAAYYGERAKGGVGLIITGVARVDKEGSATANQLGAYEFAQVGGLRKISDNVHRYHGRIFLQLHHAGRQSASIFTGAQPVAPSALALNVPGGHSLEQPRELSLEEIKKMVGKFVFGAVIAKQANFDGVEVHCAHGYLLNQFISPYSNQRTDEYGGSLENRMRIVKEIIYGIKQSCGPNFPISARISGDEFVAGGLTIEESIVVAQMLEQYGVHLINVSGGGYQAPHGISAPSKYDQGWMVPLASSVRKNVKVPVATVSLIRDFDFAETVIKNGDADFICMGRPHIADPYFVNKLNEGREDEIRPCITCLYCTDQLNSGRVGCSVNPIVGFEKEFKNYNKNGKGRKVAVIGAGPGGCEAARVLASRGFEVTLFEKNARIGGQVRLAAVPPDKFRMNWMIEYYERMLPKLGVTIKLNTEATVDAIKALKPYAIFLASGSEPIIPNIPGIKSENVFTAESILEGEVTLENKNVIVIGTGNTGLETAEYLLGNGNQITLADMLPQVGMLASGSGGYTLGDLMVAGVSVMPNHLLKSVDGSTVELTNLTNNELVSKEFDRVVISLGVKKNNAMEEALCREFDRVEVIADALQTGNIATSIKDSFRTAFYLDNYGDEF